MLLRQIILLVGLAWASLVPATPPAAANSSDCPAALEIDLSQRLRGGLTDEAVYGLSRTEAAWVLFPVTRDIPLPVDYAPADLVWTAAGGAAPQGAQPVRQMVVPDLQAMIAAARADGVSVAVLSGYRSYDTQASLFRMGVGQQLARGVASDEAEARANRFRARPGHSQHQLGTTLDLTSAEVSWGLGQRFGETQAGRWVRQHAWEYGFVLPYTVASEPRTGYAPEPWHVRWLGRELAALLMADGYLDHGELVVDDYLLAIDRLSYNGVADCSGAS